MSETPAQIIPNLFVDSVETERNFYIDKLGFEHMMGMVGKDGKLEFCIVMRNGAMIMLGRPPVPMDGTGEKGGPRPVWIYVQVPDVDKYHAEVQKNGVPVIDALTTQWWGDRNFSVDDPYGYRIWFYQTVKSFDQIEPPAGVTLV